MKSIDKYSNFLARNPWKVLLIAAILTIFMSMSSIESQETGYSDMIPDKYEVVSAFNTISENFDQSTSVTIVIKLDSGEIHDVRDPVVLDYADLLTNKVKYVTYYKSVSSITEDINDIYSEMPESLSESREFLDNPYILFEDNYISEDKAMLLIKLSLEEAAVSDDAAIEQELRTILESTPIPDGIVVDMFGEIVEGPAIERMMEPEMAKTSMLSMTGIILVLVLMFRSLKFSFLPLTTILFGVMWAMGFIGHAGMSMSSNSSGAVSMIMGIGIDFGIQIISRFREELKKADKRTAIRTTLNSTFGPIMTTTLAAVIGFQAMSLGELTFMAEMGTIMSFGVLFCMIASITVVPALLVLFTKDKKASK